MKKQFILPLLGSAFLLGAAELLPDPGFLAAKPDAAPAGLKMPAGGGQIAVETKDGKNVLKIAAKKNFYLRSLKYLSVVEGQKFTLSADVAGSGTVTLTVYCFGKTHLFCGRIAQPFKVSGRQEIKKEFTIPAKFGDKEVGTCLFDISFSAGSWELARFGVSDDRTSPDTEALRKSVAEALAGDGVVQLPGKKMDICSIAIPAGVTLRFAPGTVLNFLPGTVMTLNGRIDTPLKRIFSGDVKFAGMPDVPEVFPQWFGARGDDRNDDGPALQAAADMAKLTRNRKLNIPQGRYRIEQRIDVCCSIDCFGTLVVPIEPDYTKKTLAHYVPQFPPVKTGGILVKPDEERISLDPEPFYGIKENDFKLPKYTGIPVKNEPGRTIDLAPGGTLSLYSTDFFTARKVNNQDHTYEPNDVFEIISPLGAVFPESAFDYKKPVNVPEWSKDKVYKRGDYVMRNGNVYKATYPSGPGVVHTDKFKGTAPVGPKDPVSIKVSYSIVEFPIKYSSGKTDKLMVWRKHMMWAFYDPPQKPLVFNDLAIEIVSKIPLKEYTQIKTDGVFNVMRSNLTINRLRVESKEKFFRIYKLVGNRRCVNITYNNARVSGACHSSGGYNISNSIVGNITYNNCISTNCRDSIGARHGKYITINGGHYGVIDDHYGKNYHISNVTFHAVEPWLPGFYTPKAEPQKWRFDATCCVRFGGSDITIENCRVYGSRDLLRSRPDTADLGGRIVVRNISVWSDRPFNVFQPGQYADFDYAHDVLVPAEVVIDNVVNMGKGPLMFVGSTTPKRWNIFVSNCRNIGTVSCHKVDWHFRNCVFKDPVFRLPGDSTVALRDCTVTGTVKGFDPKAFDIGSDVKLPAGLLKK